jgi:hypothetical protein
MAYCVYIAYVRGRWLSWPNVAESYKLPNGLFSFLLWLEVTLVYTAVVFEQACADVAKPCLSICKRLSLSTPAFWAAAFCSEFRALLFALRSLCCTRGASHVGPRSMPRTPHLPKGHPDTNRLCHRLSIQTLPLPASFAAPARCRIAYHGAHVMGCITGPMLRGWR